MKKYLSLLFLSCIAIACNHKTSDNQGTTINDSSYSTENDTTPQKDSVNTTLPSRDTGSSSRNPSSKVPAGTAGEFKVDLSQSVIHWLGKKPGNDHNGTVKLSAGKIKVADGKITGGSFTIDMTTIDNTDFREAGNMKDHDKLVTHLKSEDFFNTAKYPKSTFVISHVQERPGPNGTNAIVTGNLTVKDQTHPITFPAKITVKGDQLIALATIMLDRSKFDIRYGSKTFFPDKVANNLIDNIIKLDVKVVGKK